MSIWRSLARFYLSVGAMMAIFGLVIGISTDEGRSPSWFDGSMGVLVVGILWLIAGGLTFLHPYAGLAGFLLLITGLSSVSDDPASSWVMFLGGILGMAFTFWYTGWGSKLSLMPEPMIPYTPHVPAGDASAVSAVVRAVPVKQGPVRTFWSFVLVDRLGREYLRSSQFTSSGKAPSYAPEEYRHLRTLLDDASRNGWAITQFPSNSAHEWWGYFLDR